MWSNHALNTKLRSIGLTSRPKPDKSTIPSLQKTNNLRIGLRVQEPSAAKSVTSGYRKMKAAIT